MAACAGNLRSVDANRVFGLARSPNTLATFGSTAPDGSMRESRTAITLSNQLAAVLEPTFPLLRVAVAIKDTHQA